MKKSILIIAAFIISIAIRAQLNINENFTGMTAGNLGGQNSWIGGTNDVQVSVLSNNSGALTYPNYTSGTNYISVNDIAGADPVKPFASNVGIGVNSTTYISFLVRSPFSASVTPEDVVALPSLALRTTLGNNLCYFYIAHDGGASPELKFGISKSEDGTGLGQFGTVTYTFGGLYLIVIRYSLITGSNNDGISLYVNPVLGTSGPSGSPFSVSSTGSDGGYSGALSGLQLFQSRVTAGFNTYFTPEARFDAFRVASGATAAEAWTNLSPIGTILPVTISSFKAYEKQQGIQLDWTVHSEVNLSHYEIERSLDGRGFATIGQVGASNTSAEKTYGYYDANPLSGTSFYRLKNIDIDATSKYSNILRISLDKGVKDIRLYPNPVMNGTVSFQSTDLLQGNYTITLYNLAGQQVHFSSLNHLGGAINNTIQLSKTINTGIYSLVIKNKEGIVVTAKQIIIH
jgi:Secretion system C-terminal sorting domain